MKRILYIFWISTLMFSLGACSEDTMDEINKNVNNPTDVASNLIMPDLMTSTAFSVVGSDLAFYSSIYIEYNVGIFGQMYNAEIRTSEPTSSTTYNNSWNSIYRNLKNLQVVIDKCSEGGDEEGNFHTLGMAQVLSAYNLAVLTDLMGDVPWTEAIQPGVIFTPTLDSQESIYDHVFSLLDDAIDNFGKEQDVAFFLGDRDLIYGGDEELWTMFANGLKARYTMRLSHRTPDYLGVIALADNSFKSAADEAKFNYVSGTNSPYAAFLSDRDYFGASQSLNAKLFERNDPRADILFKPHPDTEDEENTFAPNGTADQTQGVYSVSAISLQNAPTYLLSYHEIEFLKAEALVRLNELEDAEDALESAVLAALDKVNVGVTEEDAEAYMEDVVAVRFAANPLQEVMVQKYLAFFEEEAVEAYNDIRRLKAMGDDVVTLSHPQPSLFPQRFTYGSSDVTTNVNVRDAYGNGSYVYSEKVWWAGGTR